MEQHFTIFSALNKKKIWCSVKQLPLLIVLLFFLVRSLFFLLFFIYFSSFFHAFLDYISVSTYSTTVSFFFVSIFPASCELKDNWIF